MTRIPISQRLRFAILNRDHFRCRYCGASSDAQQLHIDHVTPVAKGGSNHPSNLVTACQACNLGKHTRDIIQPDAERVAEDADFLRDLISEIRGEQIERHTLFDSVLEMICWAPGYDYALRAIERHAESFKGNDFQLGAAFGRLPVLVIQEALWEQDEIGLWLAEQEAKAN